MSRRLGAQPRSDTTDSHPDRGARGSRAECAGGGGGLWVGGLWVGRGVAVLGLEAEQVCAQLGRWQLDHVAVLEDCPCLPWLVLIR